MVAAGQAQPREEVAMSRVKRVLGTILGILFIAAVVWGVVSGLLEDIKGPHRCAENYAECVRERIQVVLAASTTYASWLDAVVLNVSAVRACHKAVAIEYYFFDDVKPPASYEAIHLRLLEALKKMETLTRVTAGQLDVFPDPAAHKGFVGRREANIMKCQEELRQIQAEILQVSEGGIETPRTREVTPAAVTPATVTPSPATITYTVQSGDTLAKIAARFGVTVEQMVASNDIKDPDLVEVGQVLVIPSP